MAPGQDRKGKALISAPSTRAQSITSCFARSQLQQGAYQCRLNGRQCPERVVRPGEALQLAPHATHAQCLHHLKHCQRAHPSAQPVTVQQPCHVSGQRRTGRTVLPSSLQDLRSEHVATLIESDCDARDSKYRNNCDPHKCKLDKLSLSSRTS